MIFLHDPIMTIGILYTIFIVHKIFQIQEITPQDTFDVLNHSNVLAIVQISYQSILELCAHPILTPFLVSQCFAFTINFISHQNIQSSGNHLNVINMIKQFLLKSVLQIIRYNTVGRSHLNVMSVMKGFHREVLL